MKITYTFANCDNIYLWKMNRIQKVDDVTKEHIIQQKQSSEHEIWKPIIFMLSILGIQQHQDLPLTDQSVYGTSRVESQIAFVCTYFAILSIKWSNSSLIVIQRGKSTSKARKDHQASFGLGLFLGRCLVHHQKERSHQCLYLELSKCPWLLCRGFQ